MATMNCPLLTSSIKPRRTHRVKAIYVRFDPMSECTDCGTELDETNSTPASRQEGICSHCLAHLDDPTPDDSWYDSRYDEWR